MPCGISRHVSVPTDVTFHTVSHRNSLTKISKRCNTEDDVKNTLDCIQQVEQNKGLSKIIHSFIPKFVPRSHKGIVENQIEGLVIPEITCLDLARDGHHYDIKTSHSLVTKILQLL